MHDGPTDGLESAGVIVWTLFAILVALGAGCAALALVMWVL